MVKKNRLSLAFLILFILFFNFCAEKQAGDVGKNILKIGTTREGFKSASLLGDTFLSLFARISNPPLMTMVKDGKLEGLIVARHEVSEDCTKWKFYFDPDLYWSDGTKLTAEDAKFSI